ncbi:hypothetical protein CVT25_007898 [Psilocybe cyanescens]|uniref:tyrosinase n=1 Tax=Psilocybe cyanescens TaxID=93625 RepID=A0A409XHT0_PSICY|nr:hypothetical protein CVT25_007898 [Psilocybe cyanescens]
MTTRLLIQGALPRSAVGVAAPQRLEIGAFVRNIRQFSLYIQALQALYGRDRNNAGSHWQIGGIHGQPDVAWDGTPSGGRNGYCAHGSEIFPTWHRPYVVLFEQEVQRLARQIAATYTYDRPLWEAAAASLRQPYWGWDNQATVIPPNQVISSTTVQIMRPDRRELVSVPNPFLVYTYPQSANAAFIAPFNRWPRTVRHPDANWNSQPSRLVSALRAEAQQIVNNTQRLYSIQNWREFTLGSGGTTGLEGIHNTIHTRTGGGGNMATVETAAFDPIFYLHHAQIDRIIDLWVRRHRVGTQNAANLLPFRRTQTTYWQSRDIAFNTSIFNYSYNGPMNRMDSEESNLLEGAEVSVSEPNKIHMADNEFNDMNEPMPEASSVVANSVTPEWSVRVQCKQFEVGGSFSVYIFLSNEVPASPDEWLFHPDFAGTFDVFANSHPEQCANCTAQADELIKGFVHINDIFLAKSGQTSLEPGTVVPYLKEHISWGVTKVNGDVVDLGNFPSLEVTVLCMPLDLPAGAEYPIEGEPTIYPDVTCGRVGGDHSD